MRLLIVILFYLSFFRVYSQIKDQNLNEVSVSGERIKMRDFDDFIPSLTRKKIQELQPEDAGQLLQKFAGTQVRSYGGLGGLKTISIRGLGSQHTSFVIDGFPIVSDQTGQVNLSTIQTDNIEQIVLMNGRPGNVTASALTAGSTVSIQTFENCFSAIPHQLRFSQKLGSFQQTDTYLAYKKGDSLQRYFVSAFGKYRQAEGKYPYKIQNGKQTEEAIRLNNKYEDVNLGVSAGYRFKRRVDLNLAYKYTTIDQELPGAVMLYNSNPDEMLNQQSNRIQLNSNFQVKQKIVGRIFTSFNQSRMEYVDPNYLNSSGEIRNQYDLSSLQGGLTLGYQPKEKWVILYSAEQQYTALISSSISTGKAFRQQHYSVLSARFQTKDKGYIYGQLSAQLIGDKDFSQSKPIESHVNPFLEFRTRQLLNKTLEFMVFYRNSFRIPSFNELYYNNIGNLNLHPEKAHQYSVGADYNVRFLKFNTNIKLNAYYNRVKDKIVAVPTQNLFLWSIQNIGEVQIIGTDISSDIVFKINETNSVNLSFNYTFQSVTDRTDIKSPTYGDQVAYMPRHAGNVDLSYYWKNYGVRGGLFSNGERYSLNENIPANSIQGFMLVDLAVFGKYTFKNHTVNWQIACKNLTNVSYAFVRSYIMPGRNYLITLSYALH